MSQPQPPALPNLKRFEFLTAMIWVALAGAALILFIDFQIKNSILDSAKQARREIDALKGQARGIGPAANSDGIVWTRVLGDDGAPVEMGTVGETDSGGVETGKATSNGKPKPRPRARNPRVSGTDSTGNGDA
jgi:hypothetical protein